MQKGTDKIRGAVICAAIVIAVMAVYFGVVIWAMVCETAGGFGAILAVVLYGGIVAAIIAGVCIALKQRIKEIKGGEEEDAKKY